MDIHGQGRNPLDFLDTCRIEHAVLYLSRVFALGPYVLFSYRHKKTGDDHSQTRYKSFKTPLLVGYYMI
jgi:hypothetical protein